MSVLTMEEMQRRIDNLEAENRELRQAALELARKKLQPVPSDFAKLLETLNLIANCEASDLALAYCKGIAAATVAKHGGAA